MKVLFKVFCGSGEMIAGELWCCRYDKTAIGRLESTACEAESTGDGY